jgi:hypothetical protein
MSTFLVLLQLLWVETGPIFSEIVSTRPGLETTCKILINIGSVNKSMSIYLHDLLDLMEYTSLVPHNDFDRTYYLCVMTSSSE